MENLMNRFIDITTKYSKTIFVLIILASLPFAHFYGLQKTHNTIDVFFEENNADLVFYHQFQDTYGNEERSLIVFEDKNIFTSENISLVRQLSEMAKQTVGVNRVISITEQNLPYGEGDTVIFKPLISEQDLTPSMLAKAKQEAISSDLIRSLVLTSANATMTAIIMEFASLNSNEEKGALQIELIEKAKAIAGDRVKLLFTGTPIFENELNTLGKIDSEKFGPITLLFILVMVSLLLMRVSLAFLCLINVLLISIWSIGIYVIAGETLNLVTMMIPPVLIAIAVSDSIHVLSHFKTLSLNSMSSRYERVRQTLRVLWMPCFLTTVTTVVGFLSFLSSPVRPVKIVGIYMGLGVVIAFLITFVFIPAALLLFKKHNEAKENKLAKGPGWLERLLEKTTQGIIRHYKIIGIGAAFLFVFVFVGINNVKYITNFSNYMPAANPIKVDMDYLDKNYGGTVPIILTIHSKFTDKDFTHSESLKMVDEIQRDIMQHMSTEYTSSFSIANYFKSINKAFNGGAESAYTIPNDRLDILDFYEIGEPAEINRLVSVDKMETQISFQCINGPFDINVKLEEFVNQYLPEKLGQDYTYKFTGYGRLYVDMDANLKTSQVRSLFLAFIMVLLIMFIIAKNVKLAALAMLPNVFPIGMTLGVMGWFNIPFDVATIMVATMTLGIAVDDTIHYLVWFKRNQKAGLSLEENILKTVKDTGKPIVVTSIVLFFGFAVMMFAKTLPLQYFGLLTGCSMLFAIIGDLVLLPVLLLIFKPKITKQKEFIANPEMT